MPKLHHVAFLQTLIFTITLTASSVVLAQADIAKRTLACVACHGKQGKADSGGVFPRIAGKPSMYLYKQLLNFREGRRRYPAMSYLVAHLSDDYLYEMAFYFSQLEPAYAAPQAASLPPEQLARARQLVFHGDPSNNIPACVSCHGQRLTGVLPAIPGLLGLPPDYINAQIGAWKTGTRKADHPDCMLQVSRLLQPQDISAISAWLASQPILPDMAPAQARPLPIACASAPR